MRIILLVLIFAFHFARAGNFAPGNLVVVRVGTGSAPLTNAAQPVFLDEYTRSGTLVQSVALPAATSGSNHPFALSGNATSEGAIRLSSNGQYLTLAGYDAPPGRALVSSDSTINRVIARIGSGGVVNTSTGINAGYGYKGDNIRGAVTADGSGFWAAGNGLNDIGGTYYIPFGSFTNSPVKISPAPNNSRTVSIFNNQLYISSQTNAYNGVSAVGTGLPTSSGNSTVLFPGFYSPSSYSIFDFWLFDMDAAVPGMDVLYFCDDRDTPPLGGLYKYSLVSGTWVFNGNVPVAHSLKGLAAERTCYTQIFCSSGTKIFSLRDDNGYNQPISGTLNQIALAASNTKFRGIAFAPGTTTAVNVQASVASSTNVSCFGGNNGSINLSVSGGAPNYSFNWGSGITTQNRSNLPPGTYTVTVTDAGGCSSSATATITQPSQLSGSITKTDVSCNGGNNGSIMLSPNGGTPNYTYNWGGGVTTQNRTNLSAGTYTVTITDSKGCTATANATIAQPALLIASALKTDVNCNAGSNGTITLTASGGTPAYLYNWNDAAATQNRTNLAAGTYSVTVTDIKGCSATASVTIAQPAALSATTIATDVSCNGGSNGSIALSVNGGTSPYAYAWSNGSASQNIGNLLAGNYGVTIMDAKSCSISAIATITQPAALLSSATQANVSCHGGSNGSIDLNVTGGTLPYNYVWSNGATSQDLTGLNAATFNVTVSDSKGCSATIAAAITQPAPLTSSLTKANASCNGSSDGSIDLTVSGGTSPYAYAWSNGASSQNLYGLTAGIYNATINDANGCSLATGANITQPASLVLSVLKTNVNCFGGNNGSIDLSVSGGTIPYSYQWSDNSLTQDLTGLSAGAFTVTATDANNCSASASAVITQPGLLNASLTHVNVSCFGGGNGSVDLAVTGGTLPYAYAWTNNASTQDISGLSAGTYSVAINDAKGCSVTAAASINEPSALVASITNMNVSCSGGSDGYAGLNVSGGTPPYAYHWSNNATTANISSLIAGTYPVSASDANGCSFSSVAVITEPPTLTASFIKSDVSCNGGGNGSVNLTVSGGTIPYLFYWSNGELSEDLHGLPAGSYSATVADAKNCTVSMTAIVSQPNQLSSSLAKSDASCYGGNDGAIDLTVAGGTIPYNYNWSNNLSTQDLSDLPSGSFSVTITDANNCSIVNGALVAEPDLLLASAIQTHVTCHGANNGSVDLTVAGGTAPYSFNWSVNDTVQNPIHLRAGTYIVTVTDSRGCETMAASTITEPSAITLTQSSTDASCNGGMDGSISVAVTGGTPAYSFQWSNGATTKDLASVSAGAYLITVTDGNLCTVSATATVGEASELSVSLVAKTDVTCFGGNNGSINITAAGGTLPYNFIWSNNAATEDLATLTAGSYNVTVSDSNHCSKVKNYIINSPTAIGISLFKRNVSCNGGSDGSITASVNGGAPGYRYAWSNGSTAENIAGLRAGSYGVIVTDSNGCSVSASDAVSEPLQLMASSVKADVSCNGGNNGSIDATVSGGTSPYSYAWSNGSNLQDIANLDAGAYSMTVTDNKGCASVLINTITEPDALNASFSSVNVSCNAGNDGSISATVSGGTTPYVFSWSNGKTTPDLNSLSAMAYHVTITDANACSITKSVTISEPAAIAISYSKTNVSCYSGSDGSIVIMASGGTMPYDFIWSNGSITKDLSGLSAGLYSVTLSDSKQCKDSLNAAIIEPALLSASMAATSVSCYAGNDGSADLSVYGGTLPYRYSWYNSATTQDIGNLSAGTFTVTVTDGNTCSTLASATVTEPAALMVSASSANVSCNSGSNGAIQLDVAGGTAPYLYDWSNGAATQDINGLSAALYSVTVTDNNGCSGFTAAGITEPDALEVTISKTDVSCFGGDNGSIISEAAGGTAPYYYNWSNGLFTKTIDSLLTGNYSVTVTDDNGCSVTEGVSVAQPLPISVMLSVVNLPCYGGDNGAIDLSVSGGTTGYSFNWSNNAITENNTQLAAGTYSATITDGNNCSEIVSATVSQPDSLQVLSADMDVSCNGSGDGAISVLAFGGMPGYSYRWNNGDSAQNLTNLSPGIYILTVTDANGCNKAAIDTIAEPAPISASTDASDITCFGYANGSINLIAEGGIPPFAFNWSNGSISQNISGLAAGGYFVTVTDDNFCIATANDSIAEPDSLLLAAAVSNASVFGADDGSILLTASGGSLNYAFNWDDGGNVQNLFGLHAGSYCVTVTDENACAASNCYEVAEPGYVSVVEKQILREFRTYFAGGNLVIEIHMTSELNCEARVFDVNGKLIVKQNAMNVTDMTLELPDNRITSGMYLVTISTERGQFTRKAVTSMIGF